VNILAIGAHPDDIELGCGGSLLKAARRGVNVFMYIVTRGSSAGSVVKRSNEIINSAKYIGAKALWIDDYEDSAVYLTKELIKFIPIQKKTITMTTEQLPKQQSRQDDLHQI
jgi:LmbE family N-acetylglucosaminyl deacetylase